MKSTELIRLYFVSILQKLDEIFLEWNSFEEQSPVVLAWSIVRYYRRDDGNQVENSIFIIMWMTSFICNNPPPHFIVTVNNLESWISLLCMIVLISFI